MNVKRIINDSATILAGCYNYNIAPLMEAYDEDCLWIGPAKNRVIKSKEKIKEAYAEDFRYLKYTTYDRSVIAERLGNNCIIVLFTYCLDITYPDDVVLRYNSRAELVWYAKNEVDASGRQRRIPVLRIFQLSHENTYDARDAIHPVHIREIEENIPRTEDVSKERVVIRDVNGSIRFLDAADILWIESNAKHSYIHTAGNVYECKDSVALLEKRYARFLFRCHSSYLVNPVHICEIRRMEIILSDGTKIPVPEKKYTEVRDMLLKRTEEKVFT